MKKFKVLIVLFLVMFLNTGATFNGGNNFCDVQAEWLLENCTVCEGDSSEEDWDDLLMCAIITVEHVILCDQGLDTCNSE